MSRCDYCKYRNSWDCDDGWNRVSDDSYCESFSLDFMSLTKKQRKAIQKMLMRKEEDE